jgi:hypothetical protein
VNFDFDLHSTSVTIQFVGDASRRTVQAVTRSPTHEALLASMAKAFGLHDAPHSAIVAQRHAVTLGCLDEVEATLFDALAQLAARVSSAERQPRSDAQRLQLFYAFACFFKALQPAAPIKRVCVALLRRIVDRSTPNDS